MNSKAGDLILAGILLTLSAVFYLETLSEAYHDTGLATLNNAVFYPRILLLALALLSVGMMVQAWLRWDQGHNVSLVQYLVPVGGVLVFTILFAMIFMVVPFVLSGTLYCAGIGLLLGYRRHLILLLISVAVPGGIWLIFEMILGIQLP